MAIAALKFFKVTALPTGGLVGNAFYLVLNGNNCETYMTDINGVAKMVGNTTMIDNLIQQKFADYNALEIVNNITERNSLGATLQRNALILVIDATGDNTVTSGAAMYAYVESNQTYRKIYEMESLDVSLQWNNIQGRPTSTPAQIDAAVAASHTHANKTVLDSIGQTGTSLTNGGVEVLRTEETNW